jgi:glycoprotein endo-alpha-1,2-mannosidase
MKKLLFFCLLACSVLVCKGQDRDTLNYKLHIFYYNWYGNPETDGKYYHWAHPVLPHWSDTTWNHFPPFPGGDNIGANYYPQLGCYSCNDTAIINKHLKMIADAGIGVMVITWWGKGSFEDRSIALYLKAAEKFGVRIIIHIEPFYKTIKEFREAVTYIIDTYSNYSAFYKMNGKAMFYIYDSYKIDVKEWASILSTDSIKTLRNTKYDATYIGLWVNKGDEDFFTKGNFDGCYTYFASNGFVYGSTTDNWAYMAAWAKKNKKLFIPCVGPGYIDTRIRPWNAENTKLRDSGKYYDKMFDAAIKAKPDFIGVTSFNEWHEGTQIEPAVTKLHNTFNYENYSPLTSDFYLKRTKYWSDKFLK